MSDREPTTGTTVVETGVDEGLPGQFNPVSNSSSNPGSQASSEKHLLLLSMVKSLQSAVHSTWHLSQLVLGEIQLHAVVPKNKNHHYNNLHIEDITWAYKDHRSYWLNNASIQWGCDFCGLYW